MLLWGFPRFVYCADLFCKMKRLKGHLLPRLFIFLPLSVVAFSCLNFEGVSEVHLTDASQLLLWRCLPGYALIFLLFLFTFYVQVLAMYSTPIGGDVASYDTTRLDLTLQPLLEDLALTLQSVPL